MPDTITPDAAIDLRAEFAGAGLDTYVAALENDYDDGELLNISETMVARQNDRLTPAAREAITAYLQRRRAQPYFSNARSIRNALDRARLRPAGRLMAIEGPVPREALMPIEPADILASRVFSKVSAANA